MEKLLTVMEERSFTQLGALMCLSAACFGSSDLITCRGAFSHLLGIIHSLT